MILIQATDTENLTEDIQTQINSQGVEMKRGENFPLDIFFAAAQVAYLLPDGYYVKFVVKTFDDFLQDPPLASAQTSTFPGYTLASCGTTSASATVSCATSTAALVGLSIAGQGIPVGATVLSQVTSTSFTLSTPATATGTITAVAGANNPYVLAIDLDTADIRTEIANLPSIPCMGAVSYSPDASDGSWVEGKTIPITLTNRVSQDDDVPPPAGIATRPIWLPNVTDYVGGLANDLDSTATLSVGVPQRYAVTISGVDVPFDLISSTHATSSPDWIRPTDYAAGSNEKVFRNRSLIPGSGSVTYPISIANGGTGSTTASSARGALGLAIGTDVQAQNATLQVLAANASSTSISIGNVSIGAAAFAGSGASLTALNGSNISTGVVPAARGGAGAVSGIMKASGGGTVSAAAAGTDYLAPAAIGTTVQAFNSRLAVIAANTGTLTINGVAVVASSLAGDGSGVAALNAGNIASGILGAARGGAGTVNGLMKANGSGSVTAAVPGLDYLAPGGGSAIPGQGVNFTMPLIGGDAVANASAMRTAYTAAKALTPNGAAIAVSNRSAVVVPPGIYDFETTPLGIDGEHVDIIALTGSGLDVVFTSAVIASSSGTVAQTANDVHWSGISFQNSGLLGFPANNSTDPSCYAPSTNLTQTRMTDCYISDGTSGTWAMRVGIQYSGQFLRVHTGSQSFGGKGGTFSGIAEECSGDEGSFGGGGTCSGYIYRCLGYIDSFGGGGGTMTGRLYYTQIAEGGGSFPTPSGGGVIVYGIDGSNTPV